MIRPLPSSLGLCAELCHARCCKAPAEVRLSPQEAYRLALLKPSILYQQETTTGVLLLTFSVNGGQCPFLTPENDCGIYEVRPYGCRQFPHQPMKECLLWPS